MRKEDVSLLVVLGPTASGKTSIGVDLARRFGAEIISADSRQVYRGMDIGTGKDLADYGTDVPYHLIDIMPAGYKYNLFEYLRDFDRARLDCSICRCDPCRRIFAYSIQRGSLFYPHVSFSL